MVAVNILGIILGSLGFSFGLAGFIMAIDLATQQKTLLRTLKEQGIEVPSFKRSKVSATPTWSTTKEVMGGLSTPLPTLTGQEPTNRELAERELYTVPADAALRNEIETLLLQNKKIMAIKLARDRLGLGLADAKTWVERIERGY